MAPRPKSVSVKDLSHPSGYPIVHEVSSVELTPGWLTFTTKAVTPMTYTIPSHDVICVRWEDTTEGLMAPPEWISLKTGEFGVDPRREG